MVEPRRTELLVLGIGHLTERVKDRALVEALDRLARWSPDVIAVELLPGELVDAYTQEAGVYEMLHVGGIDQARALGAIGRGHRVWTRPEASRIARAPGTEASERVLAWLIALEPWNAVVAAERAEHLPGDVTEALETLTSGVGEVARVAVPLACRLGLAQLHHFDDHTGLECLELAGSDWWERLDAAGLPGLVEPLLSRLDASSQSFEEDVWPHWVALNGKRATAVSEEIESGLLARLAGAFPVNRIRLAQWRARNLFMAARLRAITAHAPEGRVLAIVGHSHRGPLQAALSVDQHDLRLVEITEL